MKSTKSRAHLLIIAVSGVFALPAQAYVDPGSGHLILQALGVAFFGSLFYVKQIFGFFRKLFTRSK